MRTYTFTAQCRSGQVKTFTFEAANFTAARKELERLIQEN